MATNKNIQMSEFNGVDYDILYPQTTTQQIKDFANETNKKAFKIGDVLCTARTDLGENWALCNGDTISLYDKPELKSLLGDNGVSVLFEDAISNTYNIRANSCSASNLCIADGMSACVMCESVSNGSTSGSTTETNMYLIYRPITNPFANKKLLKTGSSVDGQNAPLGKGVAIMHNGSKWVIAYTQPESWNGRYHSMSICTLCATELNLTWDEGPKRSDLRDMRSSVRIQYLNCIDGVLYFTFHNSQENSYNYSENMYIQDLSTSYIPSFQNFQTAGSSGSTVRGETYALEKFKNKIILYRYNGRQTEANRSTVYVNDASIGIFNMKDGVPTGNLTIKTIVPTEPTYSYHPRSGLKINELSHLTLYNDQLYFCGNYYKPNNQNTVYSLCVGIIYEQNGSIDTTIINYDYTNVDVGSDGIEGLIMNNGTFSVIYGKIYTAAISDINNNDAFKNSLQMPSVAGGNSYTCEYNNKIYKYFAIDRYVSNNNRDVEQHILPFIATGSSTVLPTISTDKTYNYIKIKEEAL